jgi:hypothetical protein
LLFAAWFFGIFVAMPGMLWLIFRDWRKQPRRDREGGR